MSSERRRAGALGLCGSAPVATHRATSALASPSPLSDRPADEERPQRCWCCVLANAGIVRARAGARPHVRPSVSSMQRPPIRPAVSACNAVSGRRDGGGDGAGDGTLGTVRIRTNWHAPHLVDPLR